MTLRVHLVHEPDDPDLLRTALDDSIRLTFGDTLPAAGAEVIVGGRPTETMVAQARAVVVPWAGIPPELLALVRKYPGCALHNLHHNAAQVAELAVGLLFAAAKGILPYDAALRSGDWTPRYEPARAILLAGRTAVILGYGAIGRHTARILTATGMRVIGVNRTGRREKDEPAEKVLPISSLSELLPAADALLIALPLTDATRGLIGPAEIAALPEEALIVNVGRGPIIDPQALYDALKDGRIGGAGLDVWWNYPPDADSRSHTFPSDPPLHELDNVVMSPHRGGAVKERDAGWSAALAELLNAFARGTNPPNRVDLETGY